MPFSLPKSTMRLAWLEAGARAPGHYVLDQDATDEPGDLQVFAQVRDPFHGMRFAASDQLLAVAEAVIELDEAVENGRICIDDWRALVAGARRAAENARDTPPMKKRLTLGRAA